MYKSPIEFIDSVADSFEVSMEKAKDEHVYQAVLKAGVAVDKEELLKALKYDRDQYEKGYRDGYEAGFEKNCRLICESMKGEADDEIFEVWRKIVEIYDKLEGEGK